jgi:hypothetical protein
MPTIAWFYGIAIRMYVRDHPPPHFHAIYGEHEALVAIETGAVIDGALPQTAALSSRNGCWRDRTNCVRIGAAPARASNRKRSQVSMLAKVVRLEKLSDFRLRVRFNDGSEGVHDFAAMVDEPGPMVDPLRDETYFARVFLEFGAPTWPNGFDLAPEMASPRDGSGRRAVAGGGGVVRSGSR